MSTPVIAPRGRPLREQQLAALLVEQGLLSVADLEQAQAEQQRLGKSLGRVLVERSLVTESDLLRVLAGHLGLKFVELGAQVIDTGAASLVPEALVRRHCALPIAAAESGALVVAMADPTDVIAVDDIRSVTAREIIRVVATRNDILNAVDSCVRMGESVDEVADELGITDDDLPDLSELREIVDDAPIVRFVNTLIARAVGDRASDIHIEPQERELRIRYRVDGVLHEVTTQSRRIHAGVVSRLKIMADLDIAERRVPQDGRITMKIAGRPIDLRVSTLPTVYGEKLVMRILDKNSIVMDLADLNFSEANHERFERSFRKPYGMILVTGPTGSGKSTTLYATLNVLNNDDVNIVTVEDPVEYRLPGISQVQVNPRAGLTFAGALRSILRQDPDVVLVGEMRDHETAHMGMEAALTGHMVLSTLHTNDAPSAVTRLSEMGIDPFLVASAVDVVLAQRLARRLCFRCREPYAATAAELTASGLDGLAAGEAPTLYRTVGCPHCANTGYRGRLAVHEVMPVSEDIERLIVERASTDDVAKVARSQGMRTLREDGLAKALAGLTTLEEVSRVIV